MWREQIMIIGNECRVRIKRPILSNIASTCETFFFYKMFLKILLSLISITPVVFECICWDIGGIICDP